MSKRSLTRMQQWRAKNWWGVDYDANEEFTVSESLTGRHKGAFLFIQRSDGSGQWVYYPTRQMEYIPSEGRYAGSLATAFAIARQIDQQERLSCSKRIFS